ncbi:hypothetical protein OAP63_07695 [Vibrio sp.]|uniref:Uncharacterized protein n=1 Tax=Vibrio viridaestus TaxID=2487322 RepID=A0A3N9TML0_9VIBR|nr:hypothetical protein [Vibrio viridaestus]MDC0610603.1 hypothetical protein [Vibrio sp.]RQW65093.1 hypothetical protein EES38_03405 [Vibrio viridaestus]
MNTVAKILIGIVATLQAGLGILSLFLTGTFASFFGPELASLISVLPLILLVCAALGFWAISKNSRPGQFAFAILLLAGWPAGTVIGIVTILCLLIGGNDTTPTSTAVN